MEQNDSASGFQIDEELKKLPGKPGVYIMHGSRDEILYVGKAVNLKNRVRQYFQSSRGKSAKIMQMVSRIRRFEYIVTDSELEALVLENNLIKEHRPRYNTMLKDDKTYPFIKVTVAEPFPRILFTRLVKKDRAKYFGPYTSADSVNNVIELVRRLYRIRSCSRQLPARQGKERPCLYFHMGQCLAPCQTGVSQEEYRKSLDAALKFLGGDAGETLRDLNAGMKKASEEMRFEDAAKYRDLIKDIGRIQERQKITAYQDEDRDIIALAAEEKEDETADQDAVVQVFFMREGRMIGREHFFLRIGSDESRPEVLSSFIRQYYSGTPFIPKEIMLQEPVPDAGLIEDWLSSRRGQRVYLKVPLRGTKEKMVEMAAENASMVLSKDRERIKREEGRTIGAVRQVEEWLGMTGLSRMEAYDISNISGYESVGSMIVFEKGKPRPSDYRKFRIRSVKGPDDYASMEEVLTRRFTHDSGGEFDSFARFPDLILMDGGRGQVNICLKVLTRLGLDIPVCGMVKDDHHRTRGLYFNNIEIPIDTSSEGFHLITRIQDEAHRFAIEYHRSLRSKGQVHSVLEDIPGIGQKRRKALLRKFKTVESVRAASLEELALTESMNRASAATVYGFFHSAASASQEDGPEQTDPQDTPQTDPQDGPYTDRPDDLQGE